MHFVYRNDCFCDFRLAGTAYTLQRLTTMPGIVQRMIGKSLVEFGLLIRTLGIHSLYLPSWVQAHHLRYARDLIPLGCGASDLEIGRLVVCGLTQASGVAVVGAVVGAAAYQYAVPLVFGREKQERWIELKEFNKHETPVHFFSSYTKSIFFVHKMQY